MATVLEAMNEIMFLHFDMVELSQKRSFNHGTTESTDSQSSLREKHDELEAKITNKLIAFFNDNLGAKKFLVDYMMGYKISKNYEQSDIPDKLSDAIGILFGETYEGLQHSIESTELLSYVHASIIEDMNNNYK